MATNILIDSVQFNDWAHVAGVYGPRPSLGQQVYGEEIRLVPTALLRSKENVRSIRGTGRSYTSSDTLFWDYHWGGQTDLDEYFIVPYRCVFQLHTQGLGTPANYLLSKLLTSCSMALYWEADAGLPGGLIHTSTGWTQENGGNNCQHFYGGAGPGDRDTNLQVRHYDFGFPHYSTRHILGADLKDSMSLRIVMKVAGSPISAPTKDLYYALDFEALLFDARSEFHQDYFAYLATAPARGTVSQSQIPIAPRSAKS